MKSVKELLDKWNPTGLVEGLNETHAEEFVVLLETLYDILKYNAEEFVVLLETLYDILKYNADVNDDIVNSIAFPALRRVYDKELSKPIDCENFYIYLCVFVRENYDPTNNKYLSYSSLDYDAEFTNEFVEDYVNYMFQVKK